MIDKLFLVAYLFSTSVFHPAKFDFRHPERSRARELIDVLAQRPDVAFGGRLVMVRGGEGGA
jgi:hypothetical protein